MISEITNPHGVIGKIYSKVEVLEVATVQVPTSQGKYHTILLLNPAPVSEVWPRSTFWVVG